jgi:hypothetical protein
MIPNSIDIGEHRFGVVEIDGNVYVLGVAIETTETDLDTGEVVTKSTTLPDPRNCPEGWAVMVSASSEVRSVAGQNLSAPGAEE